jgi:polyphosphate kinase 2 (PPK2 family)
MLTEDGIHLVKYWFSVSDEEQQARFQARLESPLKRWKVSPMDIESMTRWVDYSKAKDEMFAHTDTPDSPWYQVEGDDKKKERINCISHLLSVIPYKDREPPKLKLPKRPPAGDYKRPPRERFTYVPDRAAALLE